MDSVREDSVVTVDCIPYYVRGRQEKALPLEDRNAAIAPAAVVTFDRLVLTLEYLLHAFQSFEAAEDDVFRHGFTNNIIVVQIPEQRRGALVVAEDVDHYLRLRSSRLVLSPFSSADPPVPQGPYFVKQSGLHQAWRLYEDAMLSFVSAVVPADHPDGDAFRFRPLRVGGHAGNRSVVAVPSRLYFPPDPTKPLNGKRITVKDSFHLAGVVTTMGSPSYAEYYGVQKETSAYVKELLSRGAVVIGKTKMGAFDGFEAPLEKTIDYCPPYNPRGDGYQNSSGSSAGAGSAVAAYSWVDISLGTDTTGNIRMPAASHGLWGIRMTTGSSSLEGVQPSVPPFDSLGILSRTAPDILRLFAAAGNSVKLTVQKPTRILYPTDFFPIANGPQQAIQDEFQDEFLGALENYLQVPHTRMSLAEEWAETGPAECRDIPLREYMEKSGDWPNFYDGYHVYDDFGAGYQQRFGKKVYTSPFTTARWQRGIDTTKEQRDQGLRECETVAKWMAVNVLTADTIMLLPVGTPGANYRCAVSGPGRRAPFDSALNPLCLPTVLGVPNAIIPIGQNPFESWVSGKTEYAPIVGSLIGAKGTDAMLLCVAHDALKHAGWPTKVLTGRHMFHPADNARNSGPDAPQ
ncbi:amidase signature domain-containing protein [Lasiosphaeria ovina]|uniref:Amidase signature domain-containing protein n=1 Tax=Lasiosphaeria ovina TaxID=92902 RepID=A0AAE0TWJ7_9PEZI|nr:amidase signature domain-containing protein [Lasiosphaeria ovina]